MAKKNIFSWSPETYKVEALESLIGSANKDDMWAIKTEYTRLRDIAHKRWMRLGRSEFANQPAYTSHAGDFPKLREMDPRDLPKAFANMVRFLNAQTSTLSGQKTRRQKNIEEWNKLGLNLTEENYDNVMQMLREMRSRKIIYGSDKVLAVVETTMQKGWNFEEVLNSPKLAKMLRAPSKLKRIPKKKGQSLDEYFK